jgi:hypothetical protein
MTGWAGPEGVPGDGSNRTGMTDEGATVEEDRCPGLTP